MDRRINLIWAVLLAATALSWWAGEQGGHMAWSLAAGVFALAALKGVLVVLDYMELRHAPPLWHRLLLGWLAGVVTLILAWRALG